jgi:hypothetical protein
VNFDGHERSHLWARPNCDDTTGRHRDRFE